MHAGKDDHSGKQNAMFSTSHKVIITTHKQYKYNNTMKIMCANFDKPNIALKVKRTKDCSTLLHITFTPDVQNDNGCLYNFLLQNACIYHLKVYGD